MGFIRKYSKNIYNLLKMTLMNYLIKKICHATLEQHIIILAKRINVTKTRNQK